MKLVALLLLAAWRHGATYYVASATSSPPGNDAKNGSAGAPWRTLSHALGAISCGDTINIVADGKYVNGDGALPYFSCTTTTTIQSSKPGQFAPTGERTNPTNDAAIYGKLTFTSGLSSDPDPHAPSFACLISAILRTP